jgi:hypothetical protein
MKTKAKRYVRNPIMRVECVIVKVLDEGGRFPVAGKVVGWRIGIDVYWACC